MLIRITCCQMHKTQLTQLTDYMTQSCSYQQQYVHCSRVTVVTSCWSGCVISVAFVCCICLLHLFAAFVVDFSSNTLTRAAELKRTFPWKHSSRASGT